MVQSKHSAARARAFATTRWTLVLSAGEASSPESTRALATLCETYWYPLYAFARRQGHAPSQAEDLTQEFFARLLDKNYLESADPDRGRFRAFLITAFRRFLANEFERQNAQKRGGGRPALSLNVDDAEARLACEPSHDWTPARAFEREWAITLIGRVLDLLSQEYIARGKGVLFSQLRNFLVGEEPGNYEAAAAECGSTIGALRVAVHRLRQRYGELLEREIGHTVSNSEELNDEYRSLIAALRGE